MSVWPLEGCQQVNGNGLNGRSVALVVGGFRLIRDRYYARKNHRKYEREWERASIDLDHTTAPKATKQYRVRSFVSKEISGDQLEAVVVRVALRLLVAAAARKVVSDAMLRQLRRVALG